MNNMFKFNALFTMVSLLIIAADQLIKGWAINYLLPVHSIPVIPGLFYLTYVENRGAAFGIFQGNTVPLAIITAIIIIILIVSVYTGKMGGRFMSATVMIIVAGGVGNLIDRVLRGYVVDYLDFSVLFGFPVFNLADCCVVVGVGVMLLHMIVLERRAVKKGQDVK